MDETDPDEWRELLKRQAGAVSRAQALERGLTDDGLTAHLDARRWQRVRPGVYYTFTGLPGIEALRWAALLHCGAGAMFSHHTAGELWGLVDPDPEEPIHVTAPRSRSVRYRRGIVLHRPRSAGPGVGSPPRTSLVTTVLDLTRVALNFDDAVGVVTRACQRHLTTPELLAEALLARPRHRWRQPLVAAIEGISAGAHSVLELRYLADVERAHGLPAGIRQRGIDGTRQDVHYAEYSTTIELDGRLGHADAKSAWRDMARDNAATLRGETTLRFGWSDVANQPCKVAAQVGAVLRIAGWPARPTDCGTACELPRCLAAGGALARPRPSRFGRHLRCYRPENVAPSGGSWPFAHDLSPERCIVRLWAWHRE